MKPELHEPDNGMILRVGNRTLSISEQKDCVAIIDRHWNHHTSVTKTTSAFVGKTEFAAMFDALTEALNYYQNPEK